MTEERRARLWALFDQAADLAPPEQRALLDAACPDDLRAELERLLADDARYRLNNGGAFDHRADWLRIDNTSLAPEEVAERIVSHYGLSGA